MSASCCEAKSPALEKMARDQRTVLWLVLAINLVMFGVESVAGVMADSVALLGDSLDMLGDAMAYGVSLFVIGRSPLAKMRSAKFKAGIILFSSVTVMAMAIYRAFFQVLPANEVMGVIGFLALAANLFCLILLTRFRKTDVNMASVWLCSRNDIIANVSVLIAAGLVRMTGSPWPDLIVGSMLAILFVKSAFHIFGMISEENKPSCRSQA